jgi:hypothetical protein
MKKTLFALCFLSSLYVLFEACKKEESSSGTSNSDYLAKADCTGVTPTYTKDVKPIYDARCATAGCHGATNPAHNLNLSTYATAKSGFDAHATLCAINWGSGCDKMPTSGSQLSADEIKKITCWAKTGFTQ